MYRFFRGVKKLMFSFSYFEASQYFRFRKSDSYVHLSAGILSLILQLCIMTSFIYNLVYIFQFKGANASISGSYNYPPPASNVGAGANNFMVGIQKVTAADGLVIKFIQKNQASGVKKEGILGYAQPCTLSHWSGVGLTNDDFNNNGMGSWLCMPMGVQAVLEGAKNTKLYSYLAIDIECPSCAASTIQLLLHYKNPIISPWDGASSYLKYVINGQNGITVTSGTSYNAITITMQDFSVESDTTVLPWYTFIAEKGLIATETRSESINTGSATAGLKTQIVFKKSGKATLYTRNIPKLLDAFYFIIGSFAPTLLAFSFFIYPILASIFQMRFAKYVYRLEEGKQYGVITFLKQNFYIAFKGLCNLDPQKWQRYEKIIQVRQILSKVMQIQYLYERIQFLQRSTKFLFKDYHLSGLRLMRKDTVVDAQEKYKTYQIRKAIKNYVITKQRKQIQELKNSSKNLGVKLDRTDKIRDDDGALQDFPGKKQSELIDIKKITLDFTRRQPNKFQGTKQFEINHLDFESEKMCKRIDDNREYYTKLINDFKRLKKQAESYDSHDYVGKMIYDELKQNDIELMEEFERMMRMSKKSISKVPPNGPRNGSSGFENSSRGGLGGDQGISNKGASIISGLDLGLGTETALVDNAQNQSLNNFPKRPSPIQANQMPPKSDSIVDHSSPMRSQSLMPSAFLFQSSEDLKPKPKLK